MLNAMPGQLSCQEFDAFMSDYAEHRLSSPIQKRFDFHLTVCPMCRSSLASYMKTIELSKAAASLDYADDPDTPPQELIDAVLAQIALSGDGANQCGSDDTESEQTSVSKPKAD
jgi:hypothetical protein